MSPSSKGASEFVAEATEILEGLSRDLLTLDEQRGQEPDPDLLNAIFRGAHSLKGLSGMFGQERIAQLAHHAEDLLDRLRLGKSPLDDAAQDALVGALDLLHALLAEAARGEPSDDLSARAQAFGAHLANLGAEGKPASQDPLETSGLDAGVRAVLTEYEEHRLRENLRKGLALWRVRAVFDLSDFDQRLPTLGAKLKPHGETVSTLPSSQPGAGTEIAFDLLFASRAEAAVLRQALEGFPAELHAISPAKAAPSAEPEAEPTDARGSQLGSAPRRRKRPRRASDTEPPAPPPPQLPHVQAVPAPFTPRLGEVETSLRSMSQTVRVDIERLDGLMNAVGELLLTRANLQRLVDAARQPGVVAISKLWAQELQRETRQLERKLEELQKGILDVRMVPLGQVFDKLSRLVRRIAREASKEIDFQVHGGEVELDKLIVEELSDPLMHLIRNAIDHGVEPPEERLAKGKPRRGRLRLSARQQGNHVLIEVSDDGPGIDEARVREVAVTRGLVAPAQLDALGRRELQNLVFLPGFSTARSISELSGRGVGLDVVKTNIARLSGIIELRSEPGQGTTFVLTLPLTLAILRALVVGTSGRTYALPLNSVLEIVSVEPGSLRTIERQEVLSLRGQTVPFVRLARLFGLPEAKVARPFAVVVGLAQERLAIGVDELLGQQDIVAKPLGGRLRALKGISGATDLGNRRTVLVLDVGALIEEVLSIERAKERA